MIDHIISFPAFYLSEKIKIIRLEVTQISHKKKSNFYAASHVLRLVFRKGGLSSIKGAKNHVKKYKKKHVIAYENEACHMTIKDGGA